MKPLITVKDCSNKELSIREDNLAYTMSNNETSLIRVTVKRNCCQEYSVDFTIYAEGTVDEEGNVVTTTLETNKYRIEMPTSLGSENSTLYLKPEFFENADNYLALPDGIYTVTIEIINNAYNTGRTLGDSRNEVFTYCAFIDCELHCKVADKIDLLLKEDKDTDIHMIHYALTINSDCYCHCDDMCELYDQLIELLDDECLHKTCTSCH